MPHDNRFGIELDVTAARLDSARPATAAAPQRAGPSADTPFCVAVLGDFSGRGSRGLVETGRALAARRVRRIDRDDFDRVLARLAPELPLPVGEDGSVVRVRFAELDDFHPDRLVGRLPVFRWLARVREALAAPGAIAAGARDEPPAARAQPSQPPHVSRAAGAPAAAGGLLDQMLDEVAPAEAPAAAARAETRPTRPPDDLRTFIDRAVAPHLVREVDARQAELIAQVQATTAAQMRAVLQHPHFKALEALWRGIFFLVRRVETGSGLQLLLVDVSEQELRADLATDDVERSGLFRLLSEESSGTLGGAPWAVLAGCYTFGPDDVPVMQRLAGVARRLGAPWISGAEPRLSGFRTFAAPPDWADWAPPASDDWRRLRASPDARYLGLALPRFLLRLPYGPGGETADAIDFAEAGETPSHEDYLWGSPAIACALLLAESFADSGWGLRPGERLDIEDLPLHVVRAGGEPTAQPCAETLLTERAALRILESGLMPLASLKGRDAVRLVRFQSIAEPAAPLAGRWGGAGDVARA